MNRALDPRLLAAASPRQPTGGKGGNIALAVILFYAMLVPSVLYFSVGSLVIMPYRTALILLFPAVLLRISKVGLKLNLCDYLMFANAIWYFVTLFATMGLVGALEGGGHQVVDTLVSYLIGRVCFVSTDDVRRFLRIALPGLLIAAAIITVESITHLSLASTLNFHDYRVTTEVRNGLMRAEGPFPHPIIAGLFMGTCLPLFYFAFRKPASRIQGIAAALSAIFTVSSAAVLYLVVAAMLIGYTRLSEAVARRMRWTPIISVALAVIACLELFTSGGTVRLLIRYATFNPQTGYFRIAIWNYGTASVARHPLFGIGFTDYERASWMLGATIDNYWLLLAVDFGLPCAITATLALFVSLYQINRARARVTQEDSMLFIGLTIALFSMWLMLWTVAIWANVLSWVYMLIGVTAGLASGVSAVAPRPGQRRIAPTIAPPTRYGPSPTGGRFAGPVA